MKWAKGDRMLVMLAVAIVSTMAFGVGAGYLAIVGILRMFGHRAGNPAAKVAKLTPSAATLRPMTLETSGD